MRFVVVIAPDRNRFKTWCLIENDPPLNPRDPRWIVVTRAPDTRKIYGLDRHNTDVQVLEWPWSVNDSEAIFSALVDCRLWHPLTGAINIWHPTPAEFSSFWIRSN